MAIYKGSQNITPLYLGGEDISKMYLGDILVFQKDDSEFDGGTQVNPNEHGSGGRMYRYDSESVIFEKSNTDDIYIFEFEKELKNYSQIYINTSQTEETSCIVAISPNGGGYEKYYTLEQIKEKMEDSGIFGPVGYQYSGKSIDELDSTNRNTGSHLILTCKQGQIPIVRVVE